MELLEVNGAVTLGGLAQNVYKLVIPENFVGDEGMASVDGLGKGFVHAREDDDQFNIGGGEGVWGFAGEGAVGIEGVHRRPA